MGRAVSVKQGILDPLVLIAQVSAHYALQALYALSVLIVMLPLMEMIVYAILVIL